MRFLTLEEVVRLHKLIIEQSGGAAGIIELGLLESALGQCRMSFGNRELYPSITEKAAAMCFSIVRNHPFVDGNKRTGHAAMEVFLVLNGYEIASTVDETEQIILLLASGGIEREEFLKWLEANLTRL